MSINKLITVLHSTGCSLVLQNGDFLQTYHKAGVRDLEDLLDHNPQLLQGALIADKVIGKAAAAMMAVGGVAQVYGEVMSRKALPLLDANGIAWSCGTLVDGIVIPAGDNRCPLEQIVGPATTAAEAVAMLRAHFVAMQAKRNQ